MKDNDICVLTTSDKWIIGEKPGIAILDNDMLTIDCKIDTHIYIVYKEKTPNFSKPPINNNIDIKGGNKYKFEYNAQLEKGVTANLYFIGYCDNSKIQTEIINPGEIRNIVIDSRCVSYRVAIRLTGYGCFSLKNININVYDDIDTNKVKNKQKINISDIKDLKVAGILDSFTSLNLSKECNLINFTPNNWLDIFQKEKPDILFVESAWRGNNDTWQYKIGKYANRNRNDLYKVIDYCNLNSIPTIFWNKEDPVHFKKFIDTATIFDYVFTTDRDMISKYKEKLENVYTMPFAVQPKLHNPIKKIERVEGICFAGSYYDNRHEERRSDMENLLEICKNYNLIIYDRNYKSESTTSKTNFPKQFIENIAGYLKYDEIDKAYKGYKVMINVNSVKYSPTMFSRRVFEGLACGTPIVSTYSQGIKEMFGEIVICSEDDKKIEASIKELFKDSVVWKAKSLNGIREVMIKHTYTDRLRYMLSKMDLVIKKNVAKVSCIVFVNSMNEIDEAIKIFDSQVYDNKELIIIMESNFDGYIQVLNEYNTNDRRCFIGNYVKNNYTNIKDIVHGDYLSYIDLDNKYGENYILDLVIGSIYTDANIIGKSSYYSNKNKNIELVNEDREYTYEKSMEIDRCIIDIEILKNLEVKFVFELLNKHYTVQNEEDNISKDTLLVNKILKSFNNKSIKYSFLFQYAIFSIDNNNFIELGNKFPINYDLNKIFM